MSHLPPPCVSGPASKLPPAQSSVLLLCLQHTLLITLNPKPNGCSVVQGFEARDVL